MRHRRKTKILGRKKASREMLLKNLAASILIYEKVKTTEAKAKVVKTLIEKTINLAKRGDLASYRRLMSILPQKMAIKKLSEVLGKRYKDRNGGYTRIIRLNKRQGDAASMVQIELI